MLSFLILGTYVRTTDDSFCDAFYKYNILKKEDNDDSGMLESFSSNLHFELNDSTTEDFKPRETAPEHSNLIPNPSSVYDTSSISKDLNNLNFDDKSSIFQSTNMRTNSKICSESKTKRIEDDNKMLENGYFPFLKSYTNYIFVPYISFSNDFEKDQESIFNGLNFFHLSTSSQHKIPKCRNHYLSFIVSHLEFNIFINYGLTGNQCFIDELNEYISKSYDSIFNIKELEEIKKIPFQRASTGIIFKEKLIAVKFSFYNRFQYYLLQDKCQPKRFLTLILTEINIFRDRYPFLPEILNVRMHLLRSKKKNIYVHLYIIIRIMNLFVERNMKKSADFNNLHSTLVVLYHSALIMLTNSYRSIYNVKPLRYQDDACFGILYLVIDVLDHETRKYVRSKLSGLERDNIYDFLAKSRRLSFNIFILMNIYLFSDYYARNTTHGNILEKYILNSKYGEELKKKINIYFNKFQKYSPYALIDISLMIYNYILFKNK